MQFLSIVLTMISFLGQPDVDAIRKAYKAAGHDDAKIAYFNSLVKDITVENENATLVAYKGAAITLQAKVAKKLKEKKTLFIEGVNYIEKAIATNPNNIEARFIRLGIQENTPKMLKYKGNIEEDKAFVLEHYNEIESPLLKEDIKAYIIQSKIFDKEEKELLN
ncbi:hypothetical protein OOZ15_00195 [Galbibacter sp. EGI 63066]|uniref:hypothetical protein n=1 Tax=Galbibacter sp. EGI 63066 TaxID=2993559 RepID=UPI002248CDA6|nr:hypothetical protein [Galbibacter sp. EGI 63066]MCX2678349.1 hypothetical protein [Galbibacter sp. EGI 63066]